MKPCQNRVIITFSNAHTCSRINLPQETKDIPLLKDFSSVAEYHFKRVLSSLGHLGFYIRRSYVVTQRFRDLIEMLNDGTNEVTAIGGPKGVGKSWALAAIGALCLKTRPCLLWSPKLEVDADFHSLCRGNFSRVWYVVIIVYLFAPVI